jgi:TRAP-type C4-dicarboxylate transport system permease small subunit
MPFLAVAYLLRSGGHIRMDIVSRLLKPKSQIILNIVAYIFGAIVIAVITWFTLRLTISDFQNSFVLFGVIRPVKWPIEAIMPIGYFMLFIQLIREIGKNLKILKTKSYALKAS